MLGLQSFSFLNIARHLPRVLIELAFISFWAWTIRFDHSPSKRFAQSVDYFFTSFAINCGRGEGLKHALVAVGKVDDH